MLDTKSPRLGIAIGLAFLAASLAPALEGSQVTLISRTDPAMAGETAGGSFGSSSPRVSADGRYVVFLSDAPNVVAGQADTKGTIDIFLRDTVANTTVLVSHAAGSDAVTGNGRSGLPVISADGRWIAYVSRAGDLVPGQIDDGTGADLFLYDRLTGTNTLASHAAGSPTTATNGASLFPFGPEALALSADGRFLAFLSSATNLVPGQTGSGKQVYLYDRTTGGNILVSHAAGSPAAAGNGGCESLTLSADGRFVAYATGASDLAPGLTLTGGVDLFLYDRTTDTNTLISHAGGSPTTGGNFGSRSPLISRGGAYVAFHSDATNLLAGVTPAAGSVGHVFLWSRQTGEISLVSHAAGAPTTPANYNSSVEAIDADGGWVLFRSYALDLIAGQTGGYGLTNLFLYERATGSVSMVTHAFGSPATSANRATLDGSLSDDGSYVVFSSEATDLLPGPHNPFPAVDFEDVFLYERSTGKTVLISHRAGATGTGGDRDSQDPEISGSGSRVVFTSAAWDLVAGLRDYNNAQDVFIYDLEAEAAAVVSARAGAPPQTGGLPSNTSQRRASPVSADGRWVTFSSSANDLVPGQSDDRDTFDVFLHDRQTGATVLVSRRAGASPGTAAGGSGSPAISADGRYVVFASRAPDLVLGQSGAPVLNIFLFDRETGSMTLVSHAAGSPTAGGSGDSGAPVISADGSRVAFWSQASNLAATDTNGALDVFLFDRQAGSVTLVSHAQGSPGVAGNATSTAPVLSADGNFLAFLSQATNLVAGQTDGNGAFDLFLHEAAAGTTALVSHAAGSPATAGNGASDSPALSEDGSFLAFASRASNLVTGSSDGNGEPDLFLFERVTGAITLVSRSALSAASTGNAGSGPPVISSDGSWVAFVSSASDLVTGAAEEPWDTDGDVFLFARVTGSTTLVSHTPGSPLSPAGGGADVRGFSGDGRFLLYAAPSDDLLWSQTAAPTDQDAFLYDRETGESVLVSRSLASPTQPGDSPSENSHLSHDGGTIIFTSAASDLVPGNDLNGEWDVFAYDNGRIGHFYTLFPCRLFDSRRPQDGPALVSGSAVVLHLFNVCGIPETAKALAVNVTVVQPTAAGHLTLYRGEMTAPPVASTLNFGAGQVRANNAILRLAASAEGTLRVLPFVTGGGTVHVLIDVVGYFE